MEIINAQSLEKKIQILDSMSSIVLLKNKYISDIVKDKQFKNKKIIFSSYHYTRVNGFEIDTSNYFKFVLDTIFDKNFKKGLVFSPTKNYRYLKDGEKDNNYKIGDSVRFDQIQSIQIYFAQKHNAPFYQSSSKRFELIEIIIVKQVNIPKEEEPEQSENMALSNVEENQKIISYDKKYTWYSLSGTNLKLALEETGNNLYSKILRLYDKRTNDIILSPYFPLPNKGPFLVSDSSIVKFVNIFNNTPDFSIYTEEYNQNQTLKPNKPIGFVPGKLNLFGKVQSLSNITPNTINTFKIKMKNESQGNIVVKSINIEPQTKTLKIKNNLNIIKPDETSILEIDYIETEPLKETKANLVIIWTDGVEEYKSIVELNAKTKYLPPEFFADLSLPFMTGIVRTFNGFNEKWNFSFKLGNKEINYPYFSTGNFSVLAGYQNIVKFGIVLPVNLTNGEVFNIGSIVAPQRKIHGTFGLTFDFNLQPTTVTSINNAFALGGYFYYGKIKDGKEYNIKPINENNDFYYVPIILQVYYPLIFKDLEKNPKNIFQIKAGFSYHQVKREHVITKSEIGTIFYGKDERLVTKDDVGKVYEAELIKKVPSPLVQAEYMNLNDNNKFGFGFQYVNNIINFDAWLEIIKERMRVEVSYVQPLRDAEEWENSAFFLPSLRLYFPF